MQGAGLIISCYATYLGTVIGLSLKVSWYWRTVYREAPLVGLPRYPCWLSLLPWTTPHSLPTYLSKDSNVGISMQRGVSKHNKGSKNKMPHRISRFIRE
ncbi:hypothetical protein GGR55DRAFT_5575 [Xylaria sp. FL0064]|nr:hypothetical protein GGR55DRAFT_5575 [Xylaria sp. FL0064]